MGGFLTNIFIRSDDQHAVVAAARRVLGPGHRWNPMRLVARLVGKPAPVVPREGPSMSMILGAMGRVYGPDAAAMFISPSLQGWVGLYDSRLGGDCSGTVVKLSRRLRGAAVLGYGVYDGDFLSYWLARDGRLLDTYNSIPEYFGPVSPTKSEALRGKPEVLANACGMPGAAEQLEELLHHRRRDGFTLLDELSEILGMKNTQVKWDDLNAGADPYADFRWIPGASEALDKLPKVPPISERVEGYGGFVRLNVDDL